MKQIWAILSSIFTKNHIILFSIVKYHSFLSYYAYFPRLAIKMVNFIYPNQIMEEPCCNELSLLVSGPCMRPVVSRSSSVCFSLLILSGIHASGDFERNRAQKRMRKCLKMPKNAYKNATKRMQNARENANKSACENVRQCPQKCLRKCPQNCLIKYPIIAWENIQKTSTKCH
jgi:hypothetical protein